VMMFSRGSIFKHL